MLIELVLIMLSLSYDCLFSKLGSYSSELNTHPFILLYLAGLCKYAKLEIRIGTVLIYQYYESITGSNTIDLTVIRVEDLQANLFSVKGTVNIKINEDLLYFVYNDGKED